MADDDKTVDIREVPLTHEGLAGFDYVNHRGDDHRYLVRLDEDALEYSVYGAEPDPEGIKTWNLRVFVLERDGEVRENERVFMLSKIRNFVEVES